MTLTTTDDLDESGQLAQRLAKGRYTIEEAVKTLCDNEEGIDYDFMIANLRRLVEKGQDTVYEPSIVAPSYEPKTIRNNYEEAYWYNLNAMWLPRFDNIEWRFPDPLEQLVPDWSYWACDHLSLQDALCLSVNITPDWNKYTKVIGRKNVLNISFEYSPRLTNALNWAQNPDGLWRYDNPNGFKETNQVKLSEFAKWVVLEKPDWAISDEFKALAKLGEAPNKSNIKSKRGRPPALNEDEIAKLIQMRIDKPTLSHDSLADEFGVSRKYVGDLFRRKGIN
jgi:biotin operon repressor